MRFRALIQARLNSERLPEKVLAKIGKKTILEHIYERLSLLEGMGLEICFAIAEENDATLANFLTQHSFKFAIGENFDVLARFLSCAQDMGDEDYIIRLTADNPFIDAAQLGKLISHLKVQPSDHAYTADLPLGMGCEAVRLNALRSIMLHATPINPNDKTVLKAHHREHVTMFLKEYPHLYGSYALRLDETMDVEDARQRIKGIRLTIDEPADLLVAVRAFTHFNALGKPYFGALDVIQLKKNNPEMLAGNESVIQRSPLSSDSRFT